jgi:hypothetical protein
MAAGATVGKGGKLIELLKLKIPTELCSFTELE